MAIRRPCLAIFLVMLVLAPQVNAHAVPGCASTIRELRSLVGDPLFPHRWEEVSMTDGKPLVGSIVERNGALLLEFVKADEGLWAEISTVICRTGADLEAHMSKEQIWLGPAAHWMLRLALADGGVFTLQRHVANQLQIATRGWSGRFVPATSN